MLLPVFLSGFGFSAALIVAIGAQNLFVLRQGLRRDHVGLVVLFCSLADATLIALGVAGLGAVIGAVPGVSAALTLGGAAFLVWYGVGALRRVAGPPSPVSAQAGQTITRGTALRQVAAFTLLNPHVYLDTVLLMGTVGQAQPAGTRVAFVAGAAGASAAWFAGLGYGARLLAPLFARPGAWRVLDGLVAVLMMLFAGLLLREGLSSF